MSYSEELFSFNGEHIVITGGAGVIAQSLASGFLKLGGRVSLWGRNTATLKEAKKEIEEAKPINSANLQIISVDCNDKKQLQIAFAKSQETFNTPTILINCVGGNKGKSDFLKQDENNFKEVLELNLMAGLLLPSQVFLQEWVDNKIQGNIINLASMASYMCFSGVWAYNAAKAGVFNLTKGMAREFAPHGIRINSLSPGFFIGKQNKALLLEEDGETLTQRGKLVIDKTPMNRFGNHTDLQGAVIFLASNRAASFVTGIDIPVDGGFLTDGI